jgi:hypothetical protein
MDVSPASRECGQHHGLRTSSNVIGIVIFTVIVIVIGIFIIIIILTTSSSSHPCSSGTSIFLFYVIGLSSF